MNSEDNARLPRCQDAPQDAPHHLQHLTIWRLHHPHQARTFQVSPRHRGGEEETADNDNVSRAASYSTVNRSPRSPDLHQSRRATLASYNACTATTMFFYCARIMYQVASTKHCLCRSSTSNKHWMNLIRGWCWSLASDGRRCPSSKYKLMCMMSMGANCKH